MHDNEQHREFVCDLVKGSVCEMVTPAEVEKLKKEGLVDNVYEVEEIEKLGKNILNHVCDQICQMRTGDGVSSNNFKCRKPNNFFLTEDNTIHYFKPLPVNFSQECMDILVKTKIM